MTPAIAKQLREPFKPEEIGKLPKVTCGHCRQSPSKNCQEHPKATCRVCGNWMTPRHIHIDYVGHAELTDRLLQVDPDWDWEPLATTADGVPFLDQHGGMWIKLTIAGKSRLGYGHADGKKGGDATKEAIGDALRNAGMRFGIALDLWGAKFEAEREAAVAAANELEESQAPTVERKADDDVWPEAATPPPPPPKATQAHHKAMHALWHALGYDNSEENRARRLAVTAKILRLPSLDSSAGLTVPQADQVIAELKERHALVKAQRAAEEKKARQQAEQPRDPEIQQ